jgi:hypothetical protein
VSLTPHISPLPKKVKIRILIFIVLKSSPGDHLGAGTSRKREDERKGWGG